MAQPPEWTREWVALASAPLPDIAQRVGVLFPSPEWHVRFAQNDPDFPEDGGTYVAERRKGLALEAVELRYDGLVPGPTRLEARAVVRGAFPSPRLLALLFAVSWVVLGATGGLAGGWWTALVLDTSGAVATYLGAFIGFLLAGALSMVLAFPIVFLTSAVIDMFGTSLGRARYQPSALDGLVGQVQQQMAAFGWAPSAAEAQDAA